MCVQSSDRKQKLQQPQLEERVVGWETTVRHAGPRQILLGRSWVFGPEEMAKLSQQSVTLQSQRKECVEQKGFSSSLLAFVFSVMLSNVFNCLIAAVVFCVADVAYINFFQQCL